MTSQEKKRWLSRYVCLDREIDRLIRERSKWMARATRMVQSYGGMPGGSGDIHSGESILLKIDAIEREIDGKIDTLLDLRGAIAGSIAAVEDREQRMLLELRYLDGETFEEIAEEMHFSPRHTLRMHGFALENISPKE
jgi:DNA-directed RNA polymerase specialized sigma subunit